MRLYFMEKGKGVFNEGFAPVTIRYGERIIEVGFREYAIFGSLPCRVSDNIIVGRDRDEILREFPSANMQCPRRMVRQNGWARVKPSEARRVC